MLMAQHTKSTLKLQGGILIKHGVAGIRVLGKQMKTTRLILNHSSYFFHFLHKFDFKSKGLQIKINPFSFGQAGRERGGLQMVAASRATE